MKKKEENPINQTINKWKEIKDSPNRTKQK